VSLYFTSCEPHFCLCGKAVDVWGLHGLSRYRSGPRHQHHHYMNNILCRAIKWAQIPAVKEEPMSLLQQDGITLLPRARGKPMAWDVTVLVDTCAKLHISHRAGEAAAAANRASASKTAKYGVLPVSHIFLCSCYGRSRRQAHGASRPLNLSRRSANA